MPAESVLAPKFSGFKITNVLPACARCRDTGELWFLRWDSKRKILDRCVTGCDAESCDAAIKRWGLVERTKSGNVVKHPENLPRAHWHDALFSITEALVIEHALKGFGVSEENFQALEAAGTDLSRALRWAEAVASKEEPHDPA